LLSVFYDMAYGYAILREGLHRYDTMKFHLAAVVLVALVAGCGDGRANPGTADLRSRDDILARWKSDR